MSDKGFLSYFSCNPANINVDSTLRMFDRGLNYIKYSIETVDDALHQQIRGSDSDFSQSYKKLEQLLSLKKKHGYKTAIVITMLNLNRANQGEDYEQLRKEFAGKDVYIYLKSEDQLWYRGDYHKTASVHWSEYCQHPWISMTVKSNAEVVMCMEDFNNEIVLGDAEKESLADIWNGKKYAQFRRNHLFLNAQLKCTEHCDMRLLGELL